MYLITTSVARRLMIITGAAQKWPALTVLAAKYELKTGYFQSNQKITRVALKAYLQTWFYY